MIRRRFPYQFKLIEHYQSSLLFNHWKKMIQIDGRYRKLYFYHHRQKDGLILREEFFDTTNKIVEEYKNRPDKLIYRSVTFSPTDQIETVSLKLHENNYAKNVLIKKMTQKFDLDTELPPTNQIKKTVFNVAANQVFIYYHYEVGKITAKFEELDRELLSGHASVNENEKDADETQDSQDKKRFHELEMLCVQ